jgi:hypothetical protein
MYIKYTSDKGKCPTQYSQPTSLQLLAPADKNKRCRMNCCFITATDEWEQLAWSLIRLKLVIMHKIFYDTTCMFKVEHLNS